jgi:hypothetical protein
MLERSASGSSGVLGATADLLEGNAATPIAPGIAAHSIIPVRGAEAGEGATDGVVTFSSARLDGVESELVIPFAGHSVQGHPATSRRCGASCSNTPGCSAGNPVSAAAHPPRDAAPRRRAELGSRLV